MRTLLILIVVSTVLISCGKPPSTEVIKPNSPGDLNKAVSVVKDSSGWKILVNDRPIFITGMNWDYYPIGTNYEYSLWERPDEFIVNALDDEMSLLKDMGVNAIRQYTGVPAKWITYIYEKYGIYTMLNHSFGRYGMTLDGEWVATTEYDDPRVMKILISEVKQLVVDYKDTPGLLFFLLGNENNYGLFWEGAETEDIPEESKSEGREKAVALYKAFNKAAIAMKEVDAAHPVALCNGDVQYLDLINAHCPDIDIFGTNIYRGASFGDAFEVMKQGYDKPVVFTEFGSDAFNAVKGIEDQGAQSYFLIENWKEIYQNAAGLGLAENSIGAFTFQFSDGWWKYGQTKNLHLHDENASWVNGGYSFDFVDGQNNMNEEWFGICAKGPTTDEGYYELRPRLAYYLLQKIHHLNPYQSNQTITASDQFFEQIKTTLDQFKPKFDKL